MASVAEKLKAGGTSEKKFPLLETGFHLSADEFHARYKQMPEHVRAELIEGIVYMASPLYSPHGDGHFLLTQVLGAYEEETPGVIGSIATSVRLDGKNEFQPDIHLRIHPECGGRTKNPENKLIIGGPEFVSEVSNTTLEMDLHEKFEVYLRDGVQEYLVWQLAEEKLSLFAQESGRFREVRRDAKGILQSTVMPGLWLNAPAILALNKKAALKTVRDGVKSPEHAAFVKQLQGGQK
jgi:Uma2 family endonuclease